MHISYTYYDRGYTDRDYTCCVYNTYLEKRGMIRVVVAHVHRIQDVTLSRRNSFVFVVCYFLLDML